MRAVDAAPLPATVQQQLLQWCQHRAWWRDGSAATGTRWSCRGFRFCSQQPHSGSQPSHNYTSRGSNALAWPLGARASGMNRVHIKLTQPKTIILKIKGKLLLHLQTTVLKSSPRTVIQEGTIGRKEDGSRKRRWEKWGKPNHPRKRGCSTRDLRQSLQNHTWSGRCEQEGSSRPGWQGNYSGEVR